MSFDDGSPEGFDAERMKARLRIAMKMENISFEKLCDDAGVAVDKALRAIELGTDGFPESLPILQKLSVALGRDPNYIPFGVDEGAVDKDDHAKIERLVWEFIYKFEVPKSHRKSLIEEALRPLTEYAVGNGSTRFRRRAVRTLKDVARLYQEIAPRLQQD